MSINGVCGGGMLATLAYAKLTSAAADALGKPAAQQASASGTTTGTSGSAAPPVTTQAPTGPGRGCEVREENARGNAYGWRRPGDGLMRAMFETLMELGFGQSQGPVAANVQPPATTTTTTTTTVTGPDGTTTTTTTTTTTNGAAATQSGAATPTGTGGTTGTTAKPSTGTTPATTTPTATPKPATTTTPVSTSPTTTPKPTTTTSAKPATSTPPATTSTKPATTTAPTSTTTGTSGTTGTTPTTGTTGTAGTAGTTGASASDAKENAWSTFHGFMHDLFHALRGGSHGHGHGYGRASYGNASDALQRLIQRVDSVTALDTSPGLKKLQSSFDKLMDAMGKTGADRPTLKAFLEKLATNLGDETAAPVQQSGSLVKEAA